MKQKIFFLTSVFLTLFCFIGLWFFRLVPVSRIWNAYHVLYIDAGIDTDNLLGLFSAAGIDGVLSVKHRPFPLPSVLAPVQHTQTYGGFTYEDLQSGYFYDKEKNFCLFYIPELYGKAALKVLKDISLTWGMDVPISIPFFAPLAVFICSAIFLAFSTNRLFYVSVQMPFLALSFAAPFYHIGSFLCLVSYFFFIIQRYWGRRYFFEQTLKYGLLFGSFFLLFVAILFLTWQAVLLLAITCFASISLLVSVMYIRRIFIQKKTFQPILIRAAQTVSVRDIFSLRFAFIPAVLIAALSIAHFININVPLQKDFKDLYIPAPSQYTAQDNFSPVAYAKIAQMDKKKLLPDLTDFLNAAWHMETYPYKKLKIGEDVLVHIGEGLEYTTYALKGEGLEEKQIRAAVFDEKYLVQVLFAALNGVNAGAEKLLASQKGFLRAEYTNAGKKQAERHSLLFTICAVLYTVGLLVHLGVKNTDAYAR